jgi:dephospho-CoA kinase
MKLIGIGGTNGSGKDTLAHFLVEKYDWLFVSVSDILRQEVMKLDLPVEREHLRSTSAELRREHGHGILVEMAVEQYTGLKPRAPGLVVASLRNPGEADKVHELGGQVVWIDADPRVRYGRIFKRRHGDKDNKTFEQFLDEEKAEMEHDGDEATLNMTSVKAKADIFITNDSNSIEEFKRSIGEALAGLL